MAKCATPKLKASATATETTQTILTYSAGAKAANASLNFRAFFSLLLFMTWNSFN